MSHFAFTSLTGNKFTKYLHTSIFMSPRDIEEIAMLYRDLCNSVEMACL